MSMKKVIDATGTLHKLMVQTLDTEQLEVVFCEIAVGLSGKVPEAYAVVPLSALTNVGKDRCGPCARAHALAPTHSSVHTAG